MVTLETDRLQLRPWRMTDLDDFYAYARTPHVGPMAGWSPHRSLRESREILTSFIAANEVWAIEFKPNHHVIGSFGLHADKHRPDIPARMIGYALSEAYWGRGIMPEAARRVLAYLFDDLGIDVVSVYHFPANNRSRRVIEKCGFIYEGTLRRSFLDDRGELLDECCYSILKQEYMKRRGDRIEFII